MRSAGRDDLKWKVPWRMLSKVVSIQPREPDFLGAFPELKACRAPCGLLATSTSYEIILTDYRRGVLRCRDYSSRRPEPPGSCERRSDLADQC
jgi:hypothetical protein